MMRDRNKNSCLWQPLNWMVIWAKVRYHRLHTILLNLRCWSSFKPTNFVCSLHNYYYLCCYLSFFVLCLMRWNNKTELPSFSWNLNPHVTISYYLSSMEGVWIANFTHHVTNIMNGTNMYTSKYISHMLLYMRKIAAAEQTFP